MRTVVAADAREAIVEHAAGEELVGHLRDDGASQAVRAGEAFVLDGLQAVQMIRHQPKQRRWPRPHHGMPCMPFSTNFRRGRGQAGTVNGSAYQRASLQPCVSRLTSIHRLNKYRSLNG